MGMGMDMEAEHTEVVQNVCQHLVSRVRMLYLAGLANIT